MIERCFKYIYIYYTSCCDLVALEGIGGGYMKGNQKFMEFASCFMNLFEGTNLPRLSMFLLCT